MPALRNNTSILQVMRVLVAMSGGVDSSVVACLLKEQGHEVVGVRFRLWQDPSAPAMAQVLPTKCCDAQTLARARSVAKQLRIPFHEVSLENEFKRDVVDPFLVAYRKGLTPNPCVLCNRVFKMKNLLKLAKKLKCDKVATGHYAILKTKRDGSVALMEAHDTGKDQSYFLSRLTQKELKHCLLPLGSLLKADVYELAKRFNVPLSRETYRESQDLCFFPEKSPAAFLRRSIKEKPGPILTRQGKIVGEHEGLPFYTIGQRHGLKIGGLRIPVFVVDKDARRNALIVAPRGEDTSDMARITSLSFTDDPLPRRKRVRLHARIRAQGKKFSGTFLHDGRSGSFRFSVPVRGITPGQHLVLYKGKTIVAGGIIAQ